MTMIRKAIVTTKTETWFNDSKTNRFVFRRQWSYEGEPVVKEKMALVITINPVSTEPFISDLTLMLIENNVRKLGLDGFIAVNLFSLVGKQKKKKYQVDKQGIEVIETLVKDKTITSIIFACGSILNNQEIALEQAQSIYRLLNANQKKQVRILTTEEGKIAHPLNAHVRAKWSLSKDVSILEKMD